MASCGLLSPGMTYHGVISDTSILNKDVFLGMSLHTIWLIDENHRIALISLGKLLALYSDTEVRNPIIQNGPS